MSSSSSSSANLQTSSIYRMSGTDLMSGLDTDEIIKALVSNTQSKIDHQEQLKQIAEWRQELYRDVITDMQTFSDTYFSYTSSETNLLSSTFFKASDITSSSGVVTATGNVSNAQGLIINSISQLAKQATYTSTHQVSDETITSGEILDSWTQSSVGGKSVVVSYNGTDYTLTMSSSVKLDSQNMSTTEGATAEFQKVVDGLNAQVEANSSLKGKVEFKLEDGKITLSPTDTGATVGLKAYSTESDPDAGQAFFNALGFSDPVSGSSVTGAALDTDVSTSDLFNKTVSSSSYLTFKLNGSEVEHPLTLGTNLTVTDGSAEAYATAIAAQLNEQIAANADLKDKLTVSAEGGVIKFTATDGNQISISGGSQNLLQGLGLTAGGAAEASTVTGTGTDTAALLKSYLGDTLSGSTLTFTLDGIAKNVTFDTSDLNSAGDIADYLQDKLDTLFGSGKITVTETDGQLQFETADTTSVLSITADDSSNVLNESGALRLGYGETNRAETGRTLDDLADEIGLAKETDGIYKITVNGKDFEFTGDTTLASVISQINSDADAGVTVSYSQTTNTFRIVSDESGSQGTVSFSDQKGNLTEALFGTAAEGSYTAGQDLIMNVTINGSTTDIVRSSNSTVLDGVTLQITGETTEPVTFSTESNVDDVAQKIVDYVNAYNKIIDKVNTLTSQTPNQDEKYAPLTDAQKEDMSDDEIEKWNTEAKKGLLQNDSALNGILRDLRSAMTSVVESAGLSLSDLGISTKAYDYTSGGQLVVDTTKLKEKLASDPDAVTELFTATDGVSTRVKNTLDKYVGTFGGDGVLLLRAGVSTRANDTSMLATQIKSYSETISKLKEQLETEESRYWSKFTAMEQALSTMNAQMGYLSSMLGTDS